MNRLVIRYSSSWCSFLRNTTVDLPFFCKISTQLLNQTSPERLDNFFWCHGLPIKKPQSEKLLISRDFTCCGKILSISNEKKLNQVLQPCYFFLSHWLAAKSSNFQLELISLCFFLFFCFLWSCRAASAAVGPCEAFWYWSNKPTWLPFSFKLSRKKMHEGKKGKNIEAELALLKIKGKKVSVNNV